MPLKPISDGTLFVMLLILFICRMNFKESLAQYNIVLSYAIFPRGVAKPTYIWLLSIFTGVSHLQHIATVSFSIVVSLLLFLAVYLLGSSVGNNTTGLWAAFFLGISPFHIFLSRTGYANDLATLFFLLGLLLLFRNWIWTSGIFMGLAFTSHYADCGEPDFFRNFFSCLPPYIPSVVFFRKPHFRMA